MIVAIIVLSLAVVIEGYFLIKIITENREKTASIDVNVQGFLLTKSDRINTRIDKFARTIKKQNTLIDIKDFYSFVKDVQVLIAKELSYRGNVREEKTSPYKLV